MVVVIGLLALGCANGLIRWGLCRGWRPRTTLLWGGLGALGSAWLAGAIWGWANGVSLVSLWQKNFELQLQAVLDVYRTLGVPEVELTRAAKMLRWMLVDAMTGWLAIGAMAATFISYHLQRRWDPDVPGAKISMPPFLLWSVPDSWIWYLLAAMGLMIWGIRNGGWPARAGLNSLLVLGSIYFIVGLAVVFFFIAQKQLPRWARVLTVLTAVAFPAVMFFILLLGVFDMWWDWRRLRRPPEND